MPVTLSDVCLINGQNATSACNVHFLGHDRKRLVGGVSLRSRMLMQSYCMQQKHWIIGKLAVDPHW